MSCKKTAFVDYGEQYKKTLYLVNSKDLFYSKDHSYTIDQDTLIVSVYCASSQPIKEDVEVKLKLNFNTFDSVNNARIENDKSYQARTILPESNYAISNLDVTIKAGSQYGLLRIPLKLSNLSPEERYVLPFTIVSNSASYDMNEKLNNLFYEINMVNPYSGLYYGTSKRDQNASNTISVDLKALSNNEVRMPIHNLVSEKEYLETNFMRLVIEDGEEPEVKNVKIYSWAKSVVTDLGNSTYNVKEQKFNLNYAYEIGGQKNNVVAELTNSLVAVEKKD